MSEAGRPLLVQPPTGRTRVVATLFIAVFLSLQVAVPLRYYLGGDPFDERFAWRMFSSLGQRSCQSTVIDVLEGATRPAALDAQLVEPWIRKLDQYQPRVVRSVLRARCTQAGVTGARYERRCIAPGGTSTSIDRLSIACASRVTTSTGDRP